MSLLKEVIAELIGMFFGDARLTIALLLLVAVAGALIERATIRGVSENCAAAFAINGKSVVITIF